MFKIIGEEVIVIVQRYCSKCKSLIPEGEDFCPKCTKDAQCDNSTIRDAIDSSNMNNTMIGISENHPSKLKTKMFIGLILILTILTVGIYEYNLIKVKMEFKSALESYLNNEVLKDLKYYQSYTLSGEYYNKLNLIFENDFDRLSTKEKYNILQVIMQKFESEHESLYYKYKLSKKIIKQGIAGLPKIFAYTSNDSNKKYEYSCVDSFTDKDGELYLDFEMSDNKSTYNSNTVDNSNNYESSSLTDDEKAFAWTAALDVVTRNLKAPSTAKFPFSYHNEDIKKIGSSSYVVNSYVDAENSFGAKIRSFFTVKVKKTGANSYIVEDLQMSE